MTWDKEKAERALTKWFTPSRPATKNYVGRATLTERFFENLLNRVGKFLYTDRLEPAKPVWCWIT